VIEKKKKKDGVKETIKKKRERNRNDDGHFAEAKIKANAKRSIKQP
jgi:hypothetical protein